MFEDVSMDSLYMKPRLLLEGKILDQESCEDPSFEDAPHPGQACALGTAGRALTEPILEENGWCG